MHTVNICSESKHLTCHSSSSM